MRNLELLDKRIAFIRRIVDRWDGIGKTKIQKISYFLQDSVDVDLEYPFRMHYYGPYSDDLDDALSHAQSLGFVDIEPDPDGFGYHVSSCEEESPWPQEYDIEKNPDVDRIDKAIDVLGELETYELELYATIHLIGGPQAKRTRVQTIETVKRLKPRFTKPQIDEAYRTLENARLI